MSIELGSRRLAEAQEVEARLSYGQKLGLTAMSMLTAVTGVTLAASEYYGHDPLLLPRNIVDLTYYDGAAPVPKEIQSSINELARESTSDAFYQFRAHALVEGDLPEDGSYSVSYFKFASETAREYNLHLIDPTPFAEQVAAAEDVTEAMDALHAYGEELGMNITLHAQSDLRDFKLQINPVQVEDIPFNSQLLENITSIMHAMSYIPKELYDYMDVHEIRFVDPFATASRNDIINSSTINGRANFYSGIVYLSRTILETGEASTVIHEMSHCLDYRMNGESIAGALRDEEFTELNNKDFAYGKKDIGEPRSTVEDYGATDIMEDKATFMEAMLSGINMEYMNSANPIIRDKYRMLLGRIEERVPGVAPYLLGIVPHEPPYYNQSPQ